MSIIIDFFFTNRFRTPRVTYRRIIPWERTFFPQNFYPSPYFPPRWTGHVSVDSRLRIQISTHPICIVRVCFIILLFFFPHFDATGFLRALEEGPCKQQPTTILLLLLLLFSLKRRHPNVCERGKNVVGAHFLGTKTVFFFRPSHIYPKKHKNILNPPRQIFVSRLTLNGYFFFHYPSDNGFSPQRQCVFF